MRALIDRPSRGYVLLPLAAPHTAGRSWSHHGPPAGELPWLSPDGGRGIQRMTYELRRPNPVGRHQRREAPARSDHQDRVQARPPTARRGRLATTAAHRRRARRSTADKTASPPTSSRSPGKLSDACTTSGNDSTPGAANAARSSRSPSPASSPASAGHSRPRPDPEPCTTSAEEAAGTIWPPRARASAI